MEKSKCCSSRVVVRGKRTMHYVCVACGEPCDVYYTTRKTWGRSPAEQIVPNKKKDAPKLTRKEIDEIRKSEDF